MKTLSLRIFGKNVISFFCHYIMSMSYDEMELGDVSLSIELVTYNSEDMIDGTLKTHVLKKIVSRNKGFCDVFVFKNHQSRVVGTVSVMYKGGREIEYKVKKIEAFIFNVYVKEAFRGNGYAGEMIKLVMEYLHEKSINEVYLAVSNNNNSAISAYKKIGFKIRLQSFFVRILKINVPYRKL